MYKINKRGDTFSFKYRDENQIERRHTCKKSVKTFQEAEKEQISFLAEQQQITEIAKTNKIDINTLLWTVFCKKFMEFSKSRKSAPEADQRVINLINKYYPDMKYFKELTRERIREFLALRKKENKEDNTINRDLHSIKSMWTFAVDPQELNLNHRNEAKGIEEFAVEPVRKDKYFTQEQITIIETKIESSRITILCWLMIHLALRLKEAVNVKWVHIDLNNKVAKIYPFKTKRKNPRPVQVPLDDELTNFLANLKHTSEYVCGGDYTDKKARGSLSKIIKERFAELGVGGTAHTCRHTYISHAIMNGVKDNLIMRWARLKKIEMLQVYGHLSPDFETATANQIYNNTAAFKLEAIEKQIRLLLVKRRELRQKTPKSAQIATN